VITIILESLDSKSLCNAEAVSKRYKEATVDAWSSVYQRELPLFKHTKPDTAVSWKEHYVNTLGGKVESHVQIYDFGIYNMNVKDHLLSYNEDGQLQGLVLVGINFINSLLVAVSAPLLLSVSTLFLNAPFFFLLLTHCVSFPCLHYYNSGDRS
jgi:hypothetical protein